jgi:hypothetical protein
LFRIRNWLARQPPLGRWLSELFQSHLLAGFRYTLESSFAILRRHNYTGWKAGMWTTASQQFSCQLSIITGKADKIIIIIIFSTLRTNLMQNGLMEAVFYFRFALVDV